MTLLDSAHSFTLTVDGVNLWSYLDRDSLRHTDAQGSEIGTLAFSIMDYAQVASITEWDEVVWADGVANWFGGYVVRVTPVRGPGGHYIIYEVHCEGYETELSRTERTRNAYENTTCGAILAAEFTATGLTGYDTSTYVSAGATLATFRTDSKLDNTVERLALLAGFEFRVDENKAVHFGLAGSDPAAFGVNDDIANCNFSTTFPVITGSFGVGIDATVIYNKVIIEGGKHPSETETTDNFVGDASTSSWKLTLDEVSKVNSVTLDGVAVEWGIDWWYNTFTTYTALIDPWVGRIRFDSGSPPGAGVAIAVKYTGYDVLSVEVDDTASQTAYGRVFTYHLKDPTISNEDAANELANAILAEYATGVTTGKFDVPRLGLRAGTGIQVDSTLLGISDVYPIRKVQNTLRGNGKFVTAAVQFGGRRKRISEILKASEDKGAYDNQPGASVSGNLGSVSLSNSGPNGFGVLTAIDPTTYFTAP